MTILIVGAGPMAMAYVEVLRALGKQIVVVGRGEQTAALFEAKTGVSVVRGGVHQLPNCIRNQIAAAIVATDIDHLAPVSIELALMGVRRILIEKPAGVDANEIRNLSLRLSMLGCNAYVAYNRRFYASTRKARDIINTDGGVTSFHFEFTEIEDRVLSVPRSQRVLHNFTMGNSSHVVDLAFFLCGKPQTSVGSTSGSLSWHPSASTFAGMGYTFDQALFTWRADWRSAGRWCIDIRTRCRRLLLEPLETIAIQEKGSFRLEHLELQDEDDRDFKPGIKLQVQAFLSDRPDTTDLISLAAHCRALDEIYFPIFSAKKIGVEK